MHRPAPPRHHAITVLLRPGLLCAVLFLATVPARAAGPSPVDDDPPSPAPEDAAALAESELPPSDVPVTFEDEFGGDDGFDADEDEMVLGFEGDFDLSLEELMDTEVESVAGRAERLIDTPAAVTILTREEIRRAGYTSVMEALRLVPGLQVRRLSANTWAISSRGFNSRFSSMLLVLVDGRAVYNTIFAGVYWDEVDLPIDALSHIEVIRGPGATIWGANAVNGVINIVTRKSTGEDSGRVVARYGDETPNGIDLHYDGRLSEDTTFRAYLSGFDQESFPAEGYPDGGDEWRTQRFGLRLDSTAIEDWTLAVQTQYYSADVGTPQKVQMPVSPFSEQRFLDVTSYGGHGIVTLEHGETDADWWQVRAYFDYAERDDEDTSQLRRTAEISVKHRWSMGDGHLLVAGASYRYRAVEIDRSFTISFTDDSYDTDLATAFIQDTVTLSPDWDLMVGTKFEYNDFTGFEVQPGVRARYTPDPERTYWAAVSRAVRTPSIIDHDLALTLQVLPGPTPIRLLGDPDNDSEELIAFEFGHRNILAEDWSYDVALFHNRYDDIIAISPTAVPTDQALLNQGEILSYGGEVTVTHDVSDDIRLSLSYAYLTMDGTDAQVRGEIDDHSEHQATLLGHWHVTEDLDLHGSWSYADRLPGADVPSFHRVDLGLTWTPLPGLEISLRGQNLTESKHLEMTDPFLQGVAIEIPRSVYLQVAWEFD